MRLTRREWMVTSAAFTIACRSNLGARADDGLDDTVARASDVIRGYSLEGVHRTATAVDRASADWLLARAREAGASPRLEPFAASRVDPTTNRVDLDSRHIEGLTMFDAPFTPPDGVSGALGPIDGDRPIAVTRVPPNGEVGLRAVRLASRHRAIVAATTGGEPG